LEEPVVRHPDEKQVHRGAATSHALQNERASDRGGQDRKRTCALKQTRQRIIARPGVIVVKEDGAQAGRQRFGQHEKQFLNEEDQVEREGIEER
jgi:hypothetical protein